VELAEKVHYRLHGKHNITKGHPSYQTGLWLGRDTESGEHIIATKYSVVNARSIRRYSTDERFDLQLLKSLKAVPWDIRGTGTFDPSFITSWDPATGTVSADQYYDDEPAPTLPQGHAAGEGSPPLPPPGPTHPNADLPQKQISQRQLKFCVLAASVH
jgi:hypothetical protein